MYELYDSHLHTRCINKHCNKTHKWKKCTNDDCETFGPISENYTIQNGGEDPYIKQKLLQNIRRRHHNYLYGMFSPPKRFTRSKSRRKNKNNRILRSSPLKNEILENKDDFDINTLENIKKLKKEYIRKGGKDIDILEKFNKTEKDLEKKLRSSFFSNNFNQYGSGSNISSNISSNTSSNTSTSSSDKYYEKNKEKRKKKIKEYHDKNYEQNKEIMDQINKEHDEYIKKLNEKKIKEEKIKEESQSGSGKIRSQYHGRSSSVMVKVPENVKKVALYSFKLKKLGFGGGLETGWKRAKQLSSKSSISIKDLKYMRAWFARHIYASYPTYKKWIKAGRPKDKSWHRKHGIISWLIWSADAGFKWVNSQKNINLLNKHYPGKNYKPMKLPK